MKKALLVFTSLVAATFLALLLVWFLCYSVTLDFILPLKYILMGEIQLFKKELDYSRQLFPRFYFIHTLVLRVGTPLLLIVLMIKLFPLLKKGTTASFWFIKGKMPPYSNEGK